MVPLFPRVDDSEKSHGFIEIGKKVLIGDHLAESIDRVCPVCFQDGLPFPNFFEVVGGDFKGCRWCPKHQWITPRRFFDTG